MENSTSGGVSVGAIIAAVLSWWANHSLGWAIFHCLCGWFYVAYYMLLKYPTVHEAWATVTEHF